MIRKSIYAALLCGSAFAISGTAFAQDPAPQAEPTEPDASDATADAAIAEAQPVDELQSKIELLQAQVEALQDALEGVKAAQVKTTPSWKGAPLFEDKEAGWSFKPPGIVPSTPSRMRRARVLKPRLRVTMSPSGLPTKPTSN